MRFLCYAFATVVLSNISTANADLITVSLDFEYPFFSGQFTVAGDVQFTVDNSVSVSGKPVDSITFTDPQGQFQTNDVFLDFRQGDDTNFPNNQYEFEIYYSDFPVFSNQPGDFLLSVATLSLEPGDSYGNEQMGTTFSYFEGSSFQTSQDGITHLTVSNAVPEPTFAGITFLGMLGVCATRRRQRKCA